jgi:hypothetical protein
MAFKTNIVEAAVWLVCISVKVCLVTVNVFISYVNYYYLRAALVIRKSDDSHAFKNGQQRIPQMAHVNAGASSGHEQQSFTPVPIQHASCRPSNLINPGIQEKEKNRGENNDSDRGFLYQLRGLTLHLVPGLISLEVCFLTPLPLWHGLYPDKFSECGEAAKTQLTIMPFLGSWLLDPIVSRVDLKSSRYGV